MSNPPQKKRKMKHCFNKKKSYCNICGKYFSSKGSHLQHMRSFHDETDIFKLPATPDLLFKSTYKTTNKKYWFNPSDVFIKYFENEMSFDFKNGNDKFRCLSCHINFINGTEYLKHEIIHYRESSVNNNVHVKQENSFHGNVENSLMVDDYGVIKCSICNKMFTTMSGFDEHKIKNCKNDKHIINHVKSIKSEENIKKENNELQNKRTLTPKLVSQQRNGSKSNQMCKLDDLELKKWWSGVEFGEFKYFECYVCSKLFTDEEIFKRHQNDHVLRNIC